MLNTVLYLLCSLVIGIITANRNLVPISPRSLDVKTAQADVGRRVIRDAAVAVALPKQEQYLRYSILEDRPALTLVIADLAEDAGLRAKYPRVIVTSLCYALLNTSSGASRYFQLDSQSGRVVTSEPIDRDSICIRFDICLLLIDIAVQAPYFEIIKIEITVIDINDNEPVFEPTYLRVEVLESQSPGNLSLIRSASDRDRLTPYLF